MGEGGARYGPVAVRYAHHDMQRIYLERGRQTPTKMGVLVHDEAARREYGQVFPFHKGQICILPMTCDRWVKTVRHRTQILYRADVSLMLYMMGVRAGDIAVECGTGTLSLTYALSKAVGSRGRVFTFEANSERYEAAKREVAQAQLENVTATERDAVEGGLWHGEMEGLEISKVLLDLPTPHLLVPEASVLLAKGGALCCFVPCIEQIQSLARVLREHAGEFSAPRMFENVEIGHQPRSTSPRGGADRVYGTIPSGQIRGHTGYLLFATKLTSPPARRPAAVFLDRP